MLTSVLRRGLSARISSIRCNSAAAAASSYLATSFTINSNAASKCSGLDVQQYNVRRNFVRGVSTHASLESNRVARVVSEKGKGWLEERAQRPHFNFTQRNAVKSNVVLMGPPGSGKSSVGRILSQKLSAPFLDIDDDFLEPHWGTSVANKLKSLGDDGFLAAEGEALQQLNVKSTVISLSGSNPLHAKSMEHVANDATIFYLDIDPSEIVARCHRMKVDRIVGQSTRSLESILAYRRSIYENSYDVRIIVSAGETPDSIAQRILTFLQRNTGKPNKYVSTRGYGCDVHSNDLDFLDVVQLGLSPDRGLFIPANLTGLKFSTGEFKRLTDLENYEELQLRVMERFPLGSRIHPSELRRILYEAYSTFDHPAILPLVPLTVRNNKKSSSPSSFFHKHMYLMETFHGPTASFKDLSLQLLPKLLRIAMDKKRENLIVESKNHSSVPPVERVGLLVATSGDTGTAALDGFSRQEGVPVVVLYPSNGVSIVQKAQMQTTGGDVLVLGVDGDFDFCQTLVKDIFNDSKLKAAFRKILPNLILSSANSMNWGRFLPQIVFSIRSYLDLVRLGRIQFGDKVNLVVPTGNFGNILGSVYAKLVLGLPLNRIVCASNSNNILFDFLNSGSYDLRKRSFTQTISPSIDILVSSNLERFLHLLSSVDPDTGKQTQQVNEEVRNYFEQLATQKHFTVSERRLKQMKEIVVGGWASEQQCLETIKQTFDLTGQYIDPHTAVAVHVANELLQADPDTPVVVSSTAHYGKFPNALCRAFHFDLPAGDENNLAKMFEHLAAISPEAYRSSMHPQLAKLIDLPTLHNEHCAAKIETVVQRIEQFFEKFAKKQ